MSLLDAAGLDATRLGAAALSAAALVTMLPVRLRREPPAIGDIIARPRSDFELQPEPVELPDEAALTPAAVLVPLIARSAGVTMLLTQRSSTMRRHSGQIAFPGGKIDAGDDGPLGAALREAHEEIGLDAHHVQPLGYLDAYLTGTGFRITPVVAFVAPDFQPILNPAEVDEVFEVPFDFLMDQANHRRDGREWKGRYRTYYAMPWGERYIWGATAGIIRSLHDRLAPAPAEPDAQETA